PLEPRYVSKVDSGNLAGHLLSLAEACRQLREGQEVPGQVAAVDRRDVARFERLAGLGVVPVVEVAPEARQAGHGGERLGEPGDAVDSAQPAEIAGGDDGQEIEPQVG